jgi:hypothetical protein
LGIAAARFELLDSAFEGLDLLILGILALAL